jgi:hypothetical protein
MRPAVLVAAALCLALAPAADAGGWGAKDWSKVQAGWEGYGVGTSIAFRSVMKIQMPEGMPAQPDQVSEERQTLLEVTPTQFKVKFDTKTGEHTSTFEHVIDRRVVQPDQIQIEDLGPESVTVEGTAYPCMKRRVTVPVKDAEPSVSLVWEHDAHGVLRMEGEAQGEGQGMTWVTTRLDVKVTVSGRELSCREVKMATEMGEMTSLFSLEVPGTVVRTQGSFDQGGIKSEVSREMIALDLK